MLHLPASLGTRQGQAWSGPNRHWVSLGSKVPLLSGLDQHCTHPGQAGPPTARGRSLAGHSLGQASGQGGHWLNTAGQASVVHYAVAANPGNPIWAVLLGLLEYCSGEQKDNQVQVPTQ